MGEPTKNEVVDLFLSELQARMSDGDKRHPEHSKEELRKIYPALSLLARTEPEHMEKVIRQMAVKYGVAIKDE